MDVKSVNSQCSFNSLYVKGVGGWFKLSKNTSKRIKGSDVRRALESAKAKRAVLLNCNAFDSAVKLPVLMTNKTAKEFVLLANDAKSNFFNKYLKLDPQKLSNVKTKTLPNIELYRLF